MTIISIAPRLPNVECQRSATERLEDALARVKSGETVMVAIVEVRNDGSTTTHWSQIENVNLMLGGLSRLMHRINAHMDAKS